MFDMKKIFNKIGKFFTDKDRWFWMLLAAVFGIISDSFYCSALVMGSSILTYAAYSKDDFKNNFSYTTAGLMAVLCPAFYGLTELLINTLDK